MSEDLSKYNTEAFEEILECFKTFSMYMRNGFPENVLEFLRNPAKYEIIDKVVTEKNIAQDLSTRLDSTMSVLSSTRLDSTEVTISLTSTLPGGNVVVSNYKEVPLHLKDDVSVDTMVRIVPGNGACLYNAAAAHVYGDPEYGDYLRRQAHDFIIARWNNYKSFVTFPFSEMVGVGANAFRVYLSTEHDFLNFLRSNDSLRMYNNSQLDIVNLANMFGIRIATFTYNINDQPPRWTWHSPHQYITSYSQHRNVEGPHMWLFHEDDCHYDLLVP